MSHISSVAQQLGEFSSLQPPPQPIPPPLRLISPFPQIILDPALQPFTFIEREVKKRAW